MKKPIRTAGLAGVIAFLMVSATGAEGKMVPGKDRLDVPAIGDGLCLHNLFQTGMVLQRDKPIRIWGWAAPGEAVNVTFGEKTQTTTAAPDRSWKVELPGLPASSEPRTLVVKGKATTLKLENVLLGDVWLLGGQSNMEFPIQDADGGALEMASANFQNIRLLTVPQQDGPDAKKSFPSLYQWSDWNSDHYRQGYWDVCSPETVREMSAIGYIFARRLHLAAQIPIGLIDASRGGTCIETWLPLELLKTIDTPEVKALLAEWDEKVATFTPQGDLTTRIQEYDAWVADLKANGEKVPVDQKRPSDLRPGPLMDLNKPGNGYASMIAPLAGFPIKGVLWHQGYNNALVPNGHVMYSQVFAKLIGAWRAAFDDPHMPFGIISQETEGDPQDLNNYLESFTDEGTYIREVHYQTFLEFQKAGDKNVGYASSFDQRRSWYHPQIKIPVGERIAGWALVTQYGKSEDIRWVPPVIQNMRVKGPKMILTMAPYEVDRHNDGPILGFAIAGKDGKFQPATAEWGNPDDRGSIVLSSPFVPKPVYYRHAWGRNPLANLKADGVPLDTLRNDTFGVADLYEIYTGQKSATPNLLSEEEAAVLLEALKAEDVKRRLKEAEAFIKQHSPTGKGARK